MLRKGKLRGMGIQEYKQVRFFLCVYVLVGRLTF